jgi:hypothetical protein
MGWINEEPGFDFRQEQEISVFSTEPRLALGPTQLPIERMPTVKQPENSYRYTFKSPWQVA